MKNGYRIHDADTAPEQARPLLDTAVAHYGFVPNAIGAMAESPETVEGYLALDDLAGRVSLTDTERHVALLAITRELQCPYCVAAHSAFARLAEVPDETVARLRGGEVLDDARLAALEAFTTTLVRQRGWFSENDVAAFLEQGFSRRNVLELILLMANKTIAVYANRVMGTDLDEALASERWEPAA